MSELLDMVTEMARRAEPPPMTRDAERRVVDTALCMSEELPAPPRAARGPIAIFAAAAVAAAALVWIAWPTAGQDADALRLTLPTNDRIAATPGAAFEVTSATPERREIAVGSGTLLFEVEPLVAEQRFEVTTSHLRASVRGTVFTVQSTERRSVVRVYSGEVVVTIGVTVHRVYAGQQLDSAAGGSGRSPIEPLTRGPLHDPAITAALADTHRAKPEPPRLEPVVSPLPRHEPEPKVARPTRAHARAWLAAGEYRRALREARARRWRLIEGDALRGLGLYREATDVYDSAALQLSADRAAAAAFLAAQVRFTHLDDAEGALTSLDRVKDSPLAERAAALRLRILTKLERTDDLREQARRYLAEFPDGSLVDIAAAALGSSTE